MNRANIHSCRLEPIKQCFLPILFLLLIFLSQLLIATTVQASQYLCGNRSYFIPGTEFTAFADNPDLISEISLTLPEDTAILFPNNLALNNIEGKRFFIEAKKLKNATGQIIFKNKGELQVKHRINNDYYYFFAEEKSQPLSFKGLTVYGNKVEVELKSLQKNNLKRSKKATKSAVVNDNIPVEVLPKGTKVKLFAKLLKQFDIKLSAGDYFYNSVATDHPAKLDIDSLRTSPEGTFKVEIRELNSNFGERSFTACVRPAKDTGRHNYHRITDIEIIKAGMGKAVLGLALPDAIKDIEGFDWGKMATPIHLQIVSSKKTANTEKPDVILTEQTYYMGSPTRSMLIAVLASLFTYLLPLWFLRQQRQSGTPQSSLNFGLFRVVKNTTTRAMDEATSTIKPVNIHPPAWYSPLWLGRARRGGASLSSLQITTWTYLVFFVAAYVFLLNGQLIDIPDQILVLLGISGAGSVAARVTANRQDERAELIITARSGKNEGELLKKLAFPAWSDLIMTRGQVDLPRLQMLVFTILTAAYVGITAMVTFQFPEVPEGLLWLMGISNGLYVMGKASEPSLADKLAQADLQRRTAVRARESKEAEVGTITTKLNNSKKDLQQLEKQLPGATDAAEQKALKEQIDQLKEIIKKLEDELNKANTGLEKAKKEELDLDNKYKEILNNLNKAIEKESETT